MFKESLKFNKSLSDWNMECCTRMSEMFKSAKSFNGDIKNWTTSSVEYMNQMFMDACDFNQDISEWDVSSVISMEETFMSAIKFNNGGEPLSWADTSEVKTMFKLFANCSNFNQDISNWNTEKVTSMQLMFDSASIFNQTVGSWDTQSLQNIQGMFTNAKLFNNGDNPGEDNKSFGWDTDKIKGSLYKTFYNTHSFNQDISSWNSGQITNMAFMFNNSLNFNTDLGQWDVRNVVNFQSMFDNANKFNQDISNWETVSATNMNGMFCNTNEFDQNINTNMDKWNTSKVTSMERMFKNTNFNGNISDWDVSKVGTLREMFDNANNFNQDISNWNMKSTGDIVNMFRYANKFNCGGQSMINWLEDCVINSNLKDFTGLFDGATSFNSSVKNWNTQNITDMRRMFKNAEEFNGDLLNIIVTNVDNMSEMFSGAKMVEQNIRSWGVKSTCNLTNMFEGALKMICKYQSVDFFNYTYSYTPSYEFFNKPLLLYDWDFRSQNYRNSWKHSLDVIPDALNNSKAIIKTHGVTTSTHERRDDGIHLNNDDYNSLTNPGGVYIDLMGMRDSCYISGEITIEIVAKFDDEVRIGPNGINSSNLFDFSNECGDSRIYSKSVNYDNKKIELVINNTKDISSAVQTEENAIDMLGFHQYVYTIGANDTRLYINNVNKLVNLGEIEFGIHLKSKLREHYLLGTNAELNGNNYFRGIIKHLRIYKGAMLPKEVSNCWAGGNSLKNSLYWSELDICTSDPIIDTTTSCPIPPVPGIPNVTATRGPPSSSRSLNVRVFLRIPPPL